MTVRSVREFPIGEERRVTCVSYAACARRLAGLAGPCRGDGIHAGADAGRDVEQLLEFALGEHQHSHLRASLHTRGDRLALTRTTVTFEDGEAGPAEVAFVDLFQVDEREFVTYVAAFNADDVVTASAELDARAAALAAAENI